ncbi:GPI mannosyltransferase 4-like [Ornithodoros turicata]
MYWWLMFATLRVALVFVPQTGYIHPDEFFQTTEVASGDIFGLKIYRSWEFTDKNPLRSAAVIHLIYGPPLFLLRLLVGSSPSPYLLLVFPRFFVCLLSFVCDYVLYRTSKGRADGSHRCLLQLATSYVVVVFHTRTFSNSVESCLLALLFLLVNSKSALLLSAVLVFGFFNRPTFLIWAFPVVVPWLAKKKRLLALLPTCICFTIAFILADTLYYRPESFAKIFVSPLSIKLPTDVVITPLNFILYNLNSSNLESHGVHPRWLHIIVNVPALFNVAGVVSIWTAIRILFSASKCTDATDRTAAQTLLFSLAVFSIFCHQEARFLVPLTVPVTLLSYRVLTFNKLFTLVWALANIVCLVFFGFIHQGGVVPCMMKLHSTCHTHECQPGHVIFTQTYMPPRHLLSVPSACGEFVVTDLGGKLPSESLLLSVPKTILVAPSWVQSERMRKLFECAPHWSGEHSSNNVLQLYSLQVLEVEPESSLHNKTTARKTL